MHKDFLHLFMSDKKVSMEGQIETVSQTCVNKLNHKTGHNDQKSLKKENIYEHNLKTER